MEQEEEKYFDPEQEPNPEHELPEAAGSTTSPDFEAQQPDDGPQHWQVPSKQPVKSLIEKVGRKFRCKICSRESDDKSNIVRHVTRMHTPAVASCCRHCGGTFKNRESLYNHVMSGSCQRQVDIDPKDPRILSCIMHDPDKGRWFCKVCNASYRQSGYTRHHVAVRHIGLENFTTQEVTPDP